MYVAFPPSFPSDNENRGVPPPLLMPGFAATGPPQPQPMPTSVFANEQGQLAQQMRIQASANLQTAVTAANGEPVAEGMTYISG